MLGSRTVADIEADLVALRAAAARAGTALACLFSSSDEFEAAVLSAGYRRRERRRWRLQLLRSAALTLVFAAALLMM